MVLEIQSPRKRAFTRTWRCPAPRRNRAPRSSDRAKCCARVRPEHERYERRNDQPNNPSNVKFDIKYMADVTVFKLCDELAGVEIPDLDGFVVTCAD